VRLLPIAALAACHSTTILEPPAIGGGQSLLLFAKSAEGLELVHAVDLSGGAPAYPAISRPDEIDLFAVELACPLDVLGLTPGRLPIRGEPSRRNELPPALAITTSHDAESQTSWTPADAGAVDELIRRIDVPDGNLCRLYGVQLGPQQEPFRVGTATLTHVMQLRSDSALVMSSDGHFYEVDAEATVTELTHLSTTTPNRAGYIGANNTYYLVGEEGSIAKGRPLEALDVIHEGGAELADLSLASGAPDGSEIFRASFIGPLERFDGKEWTSLTEGGASFDHGTYDVAWTADGVFATGVVDGRLIVRYANGELTAEEPPDGEIPEAVEDLPGIGLLLGTDRGRIGRRVGGAWVMDEDSAIDSDARVILPTARGFVYGRNRLGSWDPVAGYCPLDVQATRNVRLVVLGEKAILAASLGDRFSGQPSINIYERTDLTHPCLGK
jgi:hypothetical protein